MGSQDQHRQPDLHAAIAADQEAKAKARFEATTPEREAAEQQAKTDASLYGTAAWPALSDRRRARASQYAVAQAQDGGNDAI